MMSTNPFERSIKRRTLLKGGLALGALQFASPFVRKAVAAEKNYGPGATDSQIKIGNIMPYSGPASAYAVIGKTETAYFQKVNDEGGINGRKIDFVSYDDGYSPPKTFEQARKLVEDDGVLLIFNSLGTPTNSAIRAYMNEKKVPQLFVATGATKWNDPKQFPWTMGWQPSYQIEGRIYAKYILKELPDARIAILYQNDDYGKDYIKGLKDGLGAKAKSMVVGEQSYETTQPTIDSEVVTLQATGANVFFNVATPKFAAQAIRKVAEISWKPLHVVNNVSASIGGVLKPAGFESAQRLHRQIHTRRRQERLELHLRIQRNAHHGSGAEAMRRRSHPRERHETGRQSQELRTGALAARNFHQYKRDELRADRTTATDEVCRSDLAPVRSCDERAG
jgi:ABC-type branched-subunit amino acid transport system substrate-binding protein